MYKDFQRDLKTMMLLHKPDMQLPHGFQQWSHLLIVQGDQIYLVSISPCTFPGYNPSLAAPTNVLLDRFERNLPWCIVTFFLETIATTPKTFPLRASVSLDTRFPNMDCSPLILFKDSPIQG